MRSATTPTLPLGLILGTTALVAILVLAGAAAKAQDNTGNLFVTASVPEGCSVSGGELNFGTYDPSDNLDENGSFGINCLAGGGVSIALGPGDAADGTRRMTRIEGPGTLQYQLYQEAGRINAWGASGVQGQAKLHDVSSGSQQVTVYGRVFATQPALPGTYQDTVLITVTPQ